MTPPQFPIGPCNPVEFVDRALCIQQIERLPGDLRAVVGSLTDEQLNTPYQNWTIRQIVHHLADSHVNSYIRFKWTLTEDQPTIKAYNETDWSALQESKQGDIKPSLTLLDGLHARWVQLLRTLRPDEWDRSFFHPESRTVVPLTQALHYYAWHGRHHLAQIQWRLAHENAAR